MPEVEQQEPVMYLITGPMAAGKTTVARLLAARFSRGVHVDGDVFRRSSLAASGDDARSVAASA
jgi:adenylylsulfate kinase-like enzyme